SWRRKPCWTLSSAASTLFFSPNRFLRSFRMSRFWKIVLLVIAVLLVAGIGYRVLGGGKQTAAGQTDGMRGGNGAGKDSAPVPVTAVAAERKDVPVYVTAQGTVTAYNTVTVTPQVG